MDNQNQTQRDRLVATVDSVEVKQIAKGKQAGQDYVRVAVTFGNGRKTTVQASPFTPKQAECVTFLRGVAPGTKISLFGNWNNFKAEGREDGKERTFSSFTALAASVFLPKAERAAA